MNQERIIMGEPPDEKTKSNKGVFIVVGIILIVIGGLVFLMQSGEKVGPTVASKTPVAHQVEKKALPPAVSKTPSVSESTVSAKVQSSVDLKTSSKPESTTPITTKDKPSVIPKSTPAPETTLLAATKNEVPDESETPSTSESATLPSTKEITSLPAEEQAPVVSEKTDTKTIQEINEGSQTETLSTVKPESWVVKDGDSLWSISHNPLIYDDPFKWAKIYEANKYQIKNPDVIYPGQKFIIPRD